MLEWTRCKRRQRLASGESGALTQLKQRAGHQCTETSRTGHFRIERTSQRCMTLRYENRNGELSYTPRNYAQFQLPGDEVPERHCWRDGSHGCVAWTPAVLCVESRAGPGAPGVSWCVPRDEMCNFEATVRCWSRLAREARVAARSRARLARRKTQGRRTQAKQPMEQ